MIKTSFAGTAVTLVCLGLVGCGDSSRETTEPKRAAQVDDARIANAHQEPQNWLIHGGGWAEQRYSLLDQINVDTVSQLKPAWSADFDTNRGQESTPIVVDGVMYVTTAWSKVYALDAKTGKQLWFYDPEVPGLTGVPNCCDVVNRGVAVYEGKVFVGTIDGRLIALDAASGTPVWSAMTVEPNSNIYTITGAPRVARGKVFIGNGGGDFGGRGYVSAYDSETGKMVWRFYLVPNAPDAEPDGAASDETLAKIAAPTWFGDWHKYGGGGQVWNSIVYDPDFNQLYMATGNGLPWNYYIRSQGKGDNLFIASIVAVDADTGEYKWHYQETPGDAWDYDSMSDMMLAELDIEGEKRKVLLHPPKNGFFYVIDRATGKLLSAKPFVEGITWATHVDLKTGRPAIAPEAIYKDKAVRVAPASAHNWHPIAFSPKTGLVYLAASENSSYFLPEGDFEYVPGQPNLGISLSATFRGGAAHGANVPATRALNIPPAAPPKSYLLAWNPTTGAAAWRAASPGGGVLATAGDLVFQGRAREGVLGELAAFRADNGEQIWSYKTPNAIAAGPITYSVDGEQYVAVASGSSMLGFAPRPRERFNGRVVAFKLNGTAVLPPEPPFARPANPPEQVASEADYTAGSLLYDEYCGRCHGFDAESPNVVPDLRRSAMLTSKEAWHTVVMEGALSERGMASWSKFLTPVQAELIRAYVGEQARKLHQRESGAGP